MVELVGIYSNKSQTAKQIHDLLLLIPQGRSQQHQKTRRKQGRIERGQLASFLEDHQAGITLSDLAKLYGVSPAAVMDQAKKAGVAKRYPRLSADAVEQAVRKYADGDSLAKIGQSLGVAPGTVSLALRQAGVTLRRRRGR